MQSNMRKTKNRGEEKDEQSLDVGADDNPIQLEIFFSHYLLGLYTLVIYIIQFLKQCISKTIFQPSIPISYGVSQKEAAGHATRLNDILVEGYVCYNHHSSYQSQIPGTNNITSAIKSTHQFKFHFFSVHSSHIPKQKVDILIHGRRNQPTREENNQISASPPCTELMILNKQRRRLT